MLAYFRDTSSGVALEVVGADGRGHRRIVTDVDHRLHEGVPAWSPDSKEIAYAFEGDDERFVIRIVNVEEGQTRLVQVSRAPDFCSDYCQLYVSGMTWAPGEDIAFLIAGGDLYPEVLYAIGPDGTDQRLLSGSLDDIYVPAWSPNGGRIAFVSRKKSWDQIWVANARGDGLRQVSHVRSRTSNLSGCFYPSWSPDGSQIACDGQAGGIYLVGADGRQQQLLVRSGGAPSWKPTP
jgi:Tol biopolymer transport system component